MGKKENNPPKPFSDEAINQLNDTWEKMTSGGESNDFNSDDAKEIEVIKIIFASLMNKKNLKSLSSLTIGQRDDILDGLMLYTALGDANILLFIENLLELNRSIVSKQGDKNFLEVITDIANKSQNYIDNDSNGGILGRHR